MAKIGHEAPIKDNSNAADMTSHAADEQLRIGDPPQEPTIKDPEVPPGLKLTEKEEARVDELQGVMGLDRGTAVLQTVSRAKAHRIIGHHHASSQAAKIEAQMREKEEQKTEPGPTADEVVQLLKETDPHEQSVRQVTRIVTRSILERSERDTD